MHGTRQGIRVPSITYGNVTIAFLVLAALGLVFADLHVAALDPWAEIGRLGLGLVRPNFSAVDLKAVALTVAFAVTGVGLGSIVGLAMSLAFARSRAIRVLAAGLRSIHELFWALILIQITGLSPLTGILAVAIPYAGIFAKVYAETIEEADLAAERALPVGTSSVSRFVFARLPVLADAFKSYTLYRLECGLRSTLVLGFVGLPTIGFNLESYFSQGHYREAAALIFVFYALIATRGLWARLVTLPILIPASIAAIYGLTDRFSGDSLGVNLARFASAIVPEPLRGHHDIGFAAAADFVAWLWRLVRDQIGPGLLNTVVLSQLALTLAAGIALVLFPLICERFSGLVGRTIGRLLLIILRGTPDYVLAYVLLQLFGPSMLPAILALGFHNGGIIAFLMGRHADGLLYRRDAPRRLDLYAYETLPRLYGQFLALVLYRLEIILRESAILGILGVRTLGYHVDAAISELRLDRAAVLLVAIAALSMLVDAASRRLRKRLRIETLPTRLASAERRVMTSRADL